MFETLLFFSHSVAVDFLDSKSFCKHSHHMKGEGLMRKRHLEILGYRVIQVRKRHLQWHWMWYCKSESYYMLVMLQKMHTRWWNSYYYFFFLQIPHFEWNSMELSTLDAWKKYLKKKIYGELSSWRPYLWINEENVTFNTEMLAWFWRISRQLLSALNTIN